MRCIPLAFLPANEWKDASDKDVNLTNNNNINRACSKIYLSVVRYVIYDEEPEIDDYCKYTQIKDAITAALNKTILDVLVNKGWVVWCLYVALITFFNTRSFSEGMDFIAKHFIRGDTDTLMAVAGGLLGACYGFDEMDKEPKTRENIKKVNQYFQKTSRPKFTKHLLSEIIKSKN